MIGTPLCTFHYTADGPPVLTVHAGAEGQAEGVMKLSGALLLLQGQAPGGIQDGGGFELAAEGTALTVIPAAGAETGEARTASDLQADLVFALAQAGAIGYRGVYRCRA
jgi:hypothetical protein